MKIKNRNGEMVEASSIDFGMTRVTWNVQPDGRYYSPELNEFRDANWINSIPKGLYDKITVIDETKEEA